MALAAGSKLGSYEILSLIGAGGMGEVYRARDTRLGREVAIKVLPAERLADEQRRLRFVREAQAASALNHPHIITIYEIETAGAVDFIVMEYVRGRSLDAAIPRQGLRLGELLRIAIPVADALAAAHARSIIHRDLKPANVVLGAEGAVKVLDFGLAKLTDSDVSPEDATTTRAIDPGVSAPGVIVGTVAYMSPEQATAQAVDTRTDIFSFGALLYEMATGTRAFAGASAAETLSAVVRAQPKAPTEIGTTLPRELERLILRCLRKEPERRYQTMLDVKLELQEIQEESDSGRQAAPAIAARPRLRAGVLAAWLAGILIVAGGLWFFWPRRAAELPAMRVVPVTSLQGVEVHPTFSPDGDQVAFSWDTRDERGGIYVKFVDSTEVRRLTSGYDVFPSWSPDGRLISFARGLRGFTVPPLLYVISPVGGAERKISDCPSWRGRWAPDGRWLVHDCFSTRADERGVYLVSPDGGSRRRLTRAQPPVSHSFPDLSPDARRLVYTSCTPLPACTLEVLELTGELEPAGKPRQLRTEPFLITESTWSRDGLSVIYATEAVPFGFYLWRQAADGSRPPERIEVAGIGANGAVVARNRDRLVFARVSNIVSIHALGSGDTRPVLASALWDYHPDFSPDGTRLAFSSSRSGESVEIWLAAADGSGAQQLTRGPGVQQGSPAWSPDGRQIAFDSNAGGTWNIWLIAADGGAPRRLTNDAGDHTVPTWSRDGKWVYFSSLRDSTRDIWRIPISGGPAARVTTGGSGPIAFESEDGLDVLYNATAGESPLLAQPLSGGSTRQVLPCVPGRNFTVGHGGIYYASCGVGPERTLSVFDPRTRASRVLGTVRDGFRLANRFAVSPDGKTILSHRQSFNADLMLIENFR